MKTEVMTETEVSLKHRNVSQSQNSLPQIVNES